MAGTQGWVESAIAEMMADRQKCAGRIEKLDAAIAAFRNLRGDGPPAAPVAAPAPLQKPRRVVSARPGSADMQQAIVAALRRGPMKPGDLSAEVNADRASVRHQVKQLEARGLVVSTGTTMSRRIALAPAAAKEAG